MCFPPRSEATRELHKSTRKVGQRTQSASQGHGGIQCISNLTERKEVKIVLECRRSHGMDNEAVYKITKRGVW